MTRQRIIALAALATIAMAHAAAAAPSGPQWLAVRSLPGGGTVEINAAAIVEIGGLVRGWWRVRPDRPRPDGTAIEATLTAIDCHGLATTTLETITTGADGHVLRHDREGEAAALARLSPTTPGTLGETAARAICRMRGARRGR